MKNNVADTFQTNSVWYMLSKIYINYKNKVKS